MPSKEVVDLVRLAGQMMLCLFLGIYVLFCGGLCVVGFIRFGHQLVKWIIDELNPETGEIKETNYKNTYYTTKKAKSRI